MKMDISEDAGVVKVGLVGRLDTPGVDAVETRLTAALVPRAARAIVDLSGVEFIGSLGLRMFITIARPQSKLTASTEKSSSSGPGRARSFTCL